MTDQNCSTHVPRSAAQHRASEAAGPSAAPPRSLSAAGRGLLALASLAAAAACGSPKPPESPGIPLGGMGVSWGAKNDEQKFGFMAAQVLPVIKEVFVEYDDSYGSFGCADCHGDNLEQVDYAMPTDGLYALPEDNPYENALDFDEEISTFMMVKVTPALQKLFDEGEGPRTKATCFSCHPVAEE